MPHCKVYLKHIWTNFLVCCFELSFLTIREMQIRAPNVWCQSKSKCSLESIPHCKVYLKRFWTNMKHSDLIEDSFVNISWNRCPKSWQHQTLTFPNSLFQVASKTSWMWFLCRRHETLKLSWRQFCQHFFKSISQILATSNVDHFKFTFPRFKK